MNLNMRSATRRQGAPGARVRLGGGQRGAFARRLSGAGGSGG